MKKLVSMAAVLAVAAVFGLGTLATTPAAAAQPLLARAAATQHKRSPSKTVMALQKALNMHGARLKVDGRLGKHTRAALKEYQAKNGLKATGHLDKATRAKLGV